MGFVCVCFTPCSDFLQGYQGLKDGLLHIESTLLIGVCMRPGYAAPTLLSTLDSSPHCTQKASKFSYRYIPGCAMNAFMQMYVIHTFVNCLIC